MKPRLRAHVEVTRQHYRGRRWHVVHDPTSNQFYRLNPIAYDFVCSLDGSREVDAAWQTSLAKFGDSAPTQNEIIQLISQLYNANLLSVDSTPETEQLLRRGRERIKKKAASQAIGIMYLRVKLFNPDRLVTALEPILRPVINRWGFIAWLALLVWALASIAPHFKRLADGLDSVMSPGNLWLLPLVFLVTKAWHEFGHAVICKRFGGQVPEMGFMLLVMLPSPYVDASSAWAFSSKWQRISVGAGGMLFELFLASISALVWVWAISTGRSGELIAQITYNVMLTSGVSTVLFNANPLMRFDGYYMLADYLETPNLYQRSTKQLLHYVQRFIFRLENLIPPTTQTGERVVLTVYGILAGIYRIFLFVSITLFVMSQFFGLGLVLAIWTAAAWFLIPCGKLIHWLATSSQLGDKRGRTILTTMALVALIVGIVGLVPMPDRRFGTGVVESIERSGIFISTDGFAIEAHAKPGDLVKAGQPILTLDNQELQQLRRSQMAQLEQFKVQERQAVKEDQPALARVSLERAQVLAQAIDEVNTRIDQLIVRAPHDGVIVNGHPEAAVGGFLKRGTPLCEVARTDDLRIAATLDQRQGAWLFNQQRGPSTPVDIEIRPYSDVSQVFVAQFVEVIPAGQLRLPSAALGFKGGGQIETNARDESGRVAKRPVFAVRVTPNDPQLVNRSCSPGERVRVRFKLPPSPLLSQWIDRLKKEIQGRVNL